MGAIRRLPSIGRGRMAPLGQESACSGKWRQWLQRSNSSQLLNHRSETKAAPER